jgi:hypothetical protein
MSNTNITTTTDTTTVTVTENVVEIELNNVGVQGTPGLSGVVSVVSPITNVGSAGSAIVGINQALLSITKSQVSDFTSGTVTSAGTAQQAGTAVFATNASTAVFATTAGTSTTISGTITKSQVSDFTSGTVASASTAQQSGTAVYAVNAGTATYATTSGTAVSISGDITKSQVSDFTSGTVTTISGSITKSQVSDFTSGTVTSASTAQQSGTAVFATTSGTATYATNAGTAVFATTSGTATYATDAGTAVFATNASTAVSVSGSAITQSQIVNLTTDLAGKANLAGGNAFTGAQTVTASTATQVPITLVAASGQTANLLATAGGARIPAAGNYFIAPGITATYSADFTAGASTVTPVTIKGAASQSASILSLQNSAGSITANFTAPVNNVNRLNLGGTDLSATFGITVHASGGVGQVIRGAASQSVDLLQLQNSAGTNQFRVDQGGMTVTNSLGVAGSPSGISYAYFTTPSASSIPVVVRGATSQTSDLLQFQASGGTYAGGFERGGALNIQPTTAANGYSLMARAASASVIPVMVRGAASQTANLQEWQSSGGTVEAMVTSGGFVRANRIATWNQFLFGAERNSGGELTFTKETTATTNPGANLARLYFRDGTNAGTLKLVVRAGAAGAETTILDNIPQ